MKIALCAITIGDSELPQLKRMIDSAKNYVSEVYITTNGKKIEKTKAYLKKEGYHHSHLDWDNDFSAQRNFNFSQVKKADYILWMDSDDILVGGEYLKDIAQIAKAKGNDTVFLTYWYGCNFKGKPSLETLHEIEVHHPRERLIKPNRTIWKGRLHETPVEKEGIKYSYSRFHYIPGKESSFETAILHTGAERNITEERLKERMERNRKILEIQLNEERQQGEADPRTLLYLMKIYAESDKEEDLKQVLQMGQEYLAKSGWNEERGVCYSLMAKSMGLMGDDENAVKLLHGAISEWPTDPMLYLMLAEGYYNLQLFDKMTHWLQVALSMDLTPKSSSMQNVYQMKVLASELMLKKSLNVDKNTKEALEAAKLLYKENPTKNNKENLKYLEELEELNEACKNTDELIRFMAQKDDFEGIERLIQALPSAITDRPFISKLKNKYGKPRAWKKDEICYFANFGQPSFEKWGPESLEKGIGGSETAVIELSRRWAKKGYKVTVYGDPTKPMIEKFDKGWVKYEPYYKFNMKDKFNIFIQWRWSSLARRVSAKKFYVDLHDVFDGDEYKDLDIDGIFVKSKYHASMVEDNTIIVGNGI
ncbi:glycosyltransferase [Candidatus Micrarchaeota archaeon]|jgi:tetratricopeptide (TPR) repeat protein|nr:glycosyltransferase [Candidatus Micrarchaeota archaeon]